MALERFRELGRIDARPAPRESLNELPLPCELIAAHAVSLPLNSRSLRSRRPRKYTGRSEAVDGADAVPAAATAGPG